MRGTLVRARRATVCFFAIAGISYGVLASRIPALGIQTGANDAVIGMALLSLGIGSLAGFGLMSILQHSFAPRTILGAGAFVLLISTSMCGLAWNEASLCAGFALVGLAFGLVDVSMNTQGMRLEHHLRHNVMSGLHGAYSIGGLGGSLAGSASAAVDLSPFATYAITCAILAILAFWAQKHLIADAPRQTAKTARTHAGAIPGLIILCGFLCMAAFSVEGACAEWSALFMTSVKNCSQSVAALGYGAFSVAIATSRFMGDNLRTRWGEWRLLLAGSCLALAGQLIVLYSPTPLTLLGYVLTGIGIAPIMPVLMSLAGRRTDISPAKAATFISIFGYSGLLVIPPSIGCIARYAGLQSALLLPVAFNILLIACSPFFMTKKINSPSS